MFVAKTLRVIAEYPAVRAHSSRAASKVLATPRPLCRFQHGNHLGMGTGRAGEAINLGSGKGVPQRLTRSILRHQDRDPTGVLMQRREEDPVIRLHDFLVAPPRRHRKIGQALGQGEEKGLVARSCGSGRDHSQF